MKGANRIYEEIVKSVIDGNTENVRYFVQKALDSDLSVTEILDNGLLQAMHIIGERFEKNEIYVTELLISARGVHAGMDVIRPHLFNADEKVYSKGKIVIGTVEGDLHDIGKNLLGMVLESRGFEVIDLGVDVSPSAFVEAVTRHQPDVLCLSVLLTTTVSSAQKTIEALSGVHGGSSFKVIVGGAALSAEIASKIGADGYASNAISGAKLIEKIIERERKLSDSHSLSGAYSVEEIREIQSSFFGLTGIGMVILDNKGVPLAGGEEFSSCSKQCSFWNSLLKKRKMASLMNSTMMNRDNGVALYRCRCGLIEVSCPLVGEKGSLGTILCGHFLLDTDTEWETVPGGVPVLNEEQCNALCRHIGMSGKKVSELADKSMNLMRLEGEQQTYLDFLQNQRRLEQELKEAKLSALQYQVNPHFMFNALNTIARVALIEGDKHTEKLVSALARLMRYSLYQVKASVTVEEEVKTVTDYLMIQETRFQGRLSHRIDVDSSILVAKMPCMILQPLVENACHHGLEPTKRGGVISIQGWLDNGNVFLEVSDNGVGMSEEQQKSIFKLEDIQTTKAGPDGKIGGIGMTNVLSRLQYYFGSDCAWDIHSELNKGTTLQLSFPLMK